MSATLDMLRELFPPPKAMLTVDDVALVIRGSSTKADREAVSAAIRRGDVPPGLRKVMGRWLVPITVFAAWLDSLQNAPETTSAAHPVVRHAITPPAPASHTSHRGRLHDAVRARKKAEALLAAQTERASLFFNEVHARLSASELTGSLNTVSVHPTPPRRTL